MKTRKQAAGSVFSLSIALLLILFLNACIKIDYFPCVNAEGPVTAEIRSSQEFNAIDLRMHARVFVLPAPVHSIRVEAPDNLHPYILSRVSGQKLYLEQDRCIRNRLDDITIYVYTPAVKSLSVSGSGNISLTEVLMADQLSFDISGSGSIQAALLTQDLQTRISGSGELLLSGEARHHQAAISGSGSIHSLGLDTWQSSIRISGSGNAYVYVRNRLEGTISGSGSIYFRGNPMVSAQISGTGRILPVP